MAVADFVNFSPVFFRKPVRPAPVLSYSQIGVPDAIVPHLQRGSNPIFMPGTQGSAPPPRFTRINRGPMGSPTTAVEPRNPIGPSGALINILA